MKVCCTCKQMLELSRFYRSVREKDGFQRQCKSCSDTSNTRTRHKNPEKNLGHRKRHRDALVQEMRLYKQQHGCKACGEAEPACLELHHPDPDVKDFHPSMATSRKLFYSEAGKCIVLCANCHRKVHAGLIDV